MSNASKRFSAKSQKALQAELYKRESKMTALEDEIVNDIRNILSNRIFAIIGAQSDEERSNLINEMNSDVSSLLQNKAQKYLGITDFTNAGLGSLGAEIEQKMKSIDAYKELLVTITTAAATAWIIPGGAVAGNVAQAAGGAAAAGAATGAAKAAASGAAKAVAKGAAKKAAEVAATTAATTTMAGTFTQILGGIGSAIKAINPLEHIGTLIATNVKKNTLENMVNEKSSAIANSFLESLETPFQIEVMQPLQDSLEEKRRQISELKRKSDKEFEDFRNQRSDMQQELAQLKAML